jgi:anti-sigma factor RsiW
VILAHLRLRGRVGLLAAGALEGDEKAEVAAHVATCGRCRREHAALRAVVAALEADPLRNAEPALPLAALVRRVERAVEGASAPADRRRWWLVALPAAAAVLAAVAVVPPLAKRLGPRPAPTVVTLPLPSSPVSGTDSQEAMARLERNVARAHAARYLSEARDVLVSVAATDLDCTHGANQVDVGEAPDRSRDLLARGTLLVQDDAEAVASARAVLDDVELTLEEVAELPSCAHRQDLERLRRQVEERRLLMRIRLLTRELEG